MSTLSLASSSWGRKPFNPAEILLAIEKQKQIIKETEELNMIAVGIERYRDLVSLLIHSLVEAPHLLQSIAGHARRSPILGNEWANTLVVTMNNHGQ